MNVETSSDETTFVRRDLFALPKNMYHSNVSTMSFHTEVINKNRRSNIFKGRVINSNSNISLFDENGILKRRIFLDDIITKSVYLLSIFDIPSFAIIADNNEG